MAVSKHTDRGYLAKPKSTSIHDTMIIDDRVHKIHTVVVHRFKMGDVEDPDIYAAQPLFEWQESEAGRWVMGRAVDAPVWHRRHNDFLLWGYEYAVVARLKDVDYTFWCLKWGSNVIDT